MLHWLPTWRFAMVCAAVLLPAGYAIARVPRRGLRTTGQVISELGVMLGLYSLWGLAGSHALKQAGNAFDRGRDVWAAERWLHLPSEASIAQAVVPHANLSHLLDAYYVYGHYNGLLLMLLWLFVRHRDSYARVRLTVVLFTFTSVLIEFVPVAPPRLVTELGVPDVAMVHGDSVYGAYATGTFDQMSAMPSVHVGWAVLVSAVVVWASTSRWRLLALAHGAITIGVVVATGNHYWLDGAAASVLVALSWAATGALARVRVRRPAAVPVAAVEGAALEGAAA